MGFCNQAVAPMQALSSLLSQPHEPGGESQKSASATAPLNSQPQGGMRHHLIPRFLCGMGVKATRRIRVDAGCWG